MPIIRPPHGDERVSLLDIWERSVRATHHFLGPEDIDFYRPMVRELLGSSLEFWAACREESNTPFGFMGLDRLPAAGKTAADAWKLEALFIDPDQARRGSGALLVRHARLLHTRPKGALILDVNEQNPGALAFYRRLGFVQTGRSPVDGAGRPFPLIHMRG